MSAAWAQLLAPLGALWRRPQSRHRRAGSPMEGNPRARSPEPGCQLLMLPEALLIRVFQLLPDTRSQLSLEQTCRELCRIGKSSQAWSARLEAFLGCALVVRCLLYCRLLAGVHQLLTGGLHRRPTKPARSSTSMSLDCQRGETPYASTVRTLQGSRAPACLACPELADLQACTPTGAWTP